MGRKPIADERKYDEFRIRLTDSERAELDKAAGKLPTSTWARELLLNAARTKQAKGRKP